MGLLYNDMCREEKNNLERFGEDYQRYMKAVPRANPVAGAIRLLLRCRAEDRGTP